MSAVEPRVIYGTAWKAERTAALVGRAIAAGFRAFDTACQPKHYDEAGVGAAVAAASDSGLARRELYLQTKFTPLDGHDPRRVPYDPTAPLEEQVAESFRTSQRNLGTDYLDCLVLHSPLEDPALLLRVWRSLERIAAAGGALRLGISNCYSLSTLESLVAAARVKPVVLQNRFYAATGYDKELRGYCTAHGITYQSFWTLSANPKLLSDPAVGAIAARHRASAAQVLFRYLTQVGVVPLTGTTSPAHLRESLAIFDFELAPAELAALTALT